MHVSFHINELKCHPLLDQWHFLPIKQIVIKHAGLTHDVRLFGVLRGQVSFFFPLHSNNQDIKVDRGFSIVYVLTAGLCNLREDTSHWRLYSYVAHFYHLSLFCSEPTDLRQEKRQIRSLVFFSSYPQTLQDVFFMALALMRALTVVICLASPRGLMSISQLQRQRCLRSDKRSGHYLEITPRALRWTVLMQSVIWKSIQEIDCCLWRRSTSDILGCKQAFGKLKMSSSAE